MQNILSTQLRTEIPYEYSVIDYNNGETDTILSRLPSEIKDSSLIADSYECVEGIMAEGKVYYLSLIHISEPTRPSHISRMPSSA